MTQEEDDGVRRAKLGYWAIGPSNYGSRKKKEERAWAGLACPVGLNGRSVAHLFIVWFNYLFEGYKREFEFKFEWSFRALDFSLSSRVLKCTHMMHRSKCSKNLNREQI